MGVLHRRQRLGGGDCSFGKLSNLTTGAGSWTLGAGGAQGGREAWGSE